MNRIWGHTLSTAILALAAGSAIPACAHNDGSLFVSSVLYPPVPAEGLCVYTFAPTALSLSRGTVDAALTDSYSPEFLLGSSLIAQGDPTAPQSETARLTIQGADVRVVDPVDNSEWENADVLTTGTVEPASGATPSYLGLAATIMDAKAISHFTPGAGVASKLAEVYVKFYGNTLGGEYIESDEFLFPVDVCYGCLISFPPGSQVQPADAVKVNGVLASQYCGGIVASSSTVAACFPGKISIRTARNALDFRPLAVE